MSKKGVVQMLKPSAATPAFLALSCIGFFSSPALAIEADEGTNGAGTDSEADSLDGRMIIVRGAQDDDVRISPKATAPAINTPRSIVSVSREVIDQSGSATLAEALRTVPGITFGAAEGGNPIGDRPFIRGFDAQGSTYVDGLRDPASQSREVFDIEAVEVVRGSDSTLGGRGNAGGSINIITKLPEQRNFASGTISYGTADYKRATGDVNYMVSDSVGVRVTGVWHDQDVAGRDEIWQRRWGFAPSITVGLGMPTRLTASIYYLESHELPDSGLPYFYTIGNAPLGNTITKPVLGRLTTIAGVTGRVDRSAFYGLKDRDFRDTRAQQAMFRAEHDFGTVTLRNTARWSHNVQNYIYTQPDDRLGNVYGTQASPPTDAAATRGDLVQGGYVWRRANTRYGYTDALIDQTDLFGKFETGSIEHSFALGTEISWEKARRGTYVTRGYLGSGTTEILATGATITPRCNTATLARYYCTSLFNPTPNDTWRNYTTDTSTTPAPIVKSLPIEETQNDGHTISVYAFDAITILPQVILNLGARFDRFASALTPGQAYAATFAPRLSRTDNLFDWQAGLVFKPSPETSIYASYATASTPPNSLLGEGREDNALPTSPTAANLALLDSLEVQRTKSYEVGAKGNFFHERLALTLALFQMEINNQRVTSDANTVDFIGKTRVRGVEFTVNGHITKWWTLFGGYTHLDPKIIDGGYTALTVAAVGTLPATTVQVPAANTGKQIPQVARDSFTLWTTVEPVERLSIGAGAYYTSPVYANYEDNRSASQNSAGVITVTPATKTLARAVPAYWRFDARLGYTFDDHFELDVNVQNLTNKAYYNQVFTNHYATMAPGRSAFATLNVKY
jgi:catecholate siderophore receptor